jgi:hypothetical protein
MALFTTLMGLFWLFTEGLIMICVRGGLRFLETGRSRQRGFVFFCLGVFAAVAFLYASQGLIAGRLRISFPLFSARFYSGCLWNLTCTLWVLVEGAVAVYVLKAYRLIKKPAAAQPEPARGFSGAVLGVICALLLAGFVFYHTYLYLLTGRAAFSGAMTANALRFYIKICGLCWIFIEWMVAVMAVKAYLMLKRRDHVAGVV